MTEQALCKDGRALRGAAVAETGKRAAWCRHKKECDICSGRRVIGLGAFVDSDILTGQAFKERRKR